MIFKSKPILYLAFVFLGMVLCQAQITTGHEVLSMTKLANQAEEQLNSNDSIARAKAQKLFDLANKEKDNAYIGKSLFIIGQTYKKESIFKALEYFNAAVPFIEKSNHILLADIYYSQSNMHTFLSEFPDALRQALKSLEYNQINDNKEKVQRDMSFIGYIHDRMYEFEESIVWNRKALTLAKALNNEKAQAICYGRLGIAYDELAEKDNFNRKLFDSALYYNKKAARLSEQVGDLSYARTTYSNIGNTYSKLKNYAKAEEYTLKSLAVPGFEENKGVTLVNLGKIYLETGRYDEAKKILDSAMRNTTHFGTRKYQLEAYYRFHELDKKKGDYKNALKNYVSYKEIEDSLLNKTKTKQIIEARERYQAADKERQILIQRAELAEQQLTIQNKNYQLYSVLALAIILAIIGYLFYNQQKLKNKQLKKENELKDALIKIETQNKLQEQRLQISRDLHDNIGAQLTFIISSIDNLKYGFDIQDEQLNKRLDAISNFTSETIYELRDTIWAMNKEEISIEDIILRITNYKDKAKFAAKNMGFNIHVSDKVDIQKTFSSPTGIAIHRVVQEAVHNAIKYSQASEIQIRIDKPNHYEFSISDNGKGFDLDSTDKGNGLVNMEKRIQDIGGTFVMISTPGKGTLVKIKLPD